MDFQGQRKQVAKYGKKSRVVGVNFFDDGGKSASTIFAPTLKKYPISPSSAGENSNKEDASSIPQPTPALSSSSPSPVMKPAHITAHSRSSHSGTRSPSPIKPTSKPSTTIDVATFDILSSDDENEMVSQRPLKKRKLTQTLKQQKARPTASKIEPRTLPSVLKGKPQPSIKEPESVSETRPEVKANEKQRKESAKASRAIEDEAVQIPALSLAPKTVKPDGKLRSKKILAVSKSIDKPEAPMDEKQDLQVTKQSEPSPVNRVKSRTKLKKIPTKAKPGQVPVKLVEQADVMVIDADELEEPPVQKKRTYVRTKPAPDETPKRRRQFSPARSETSAASPGSRLFSELRLSPSKSPMPASSREVSSSPIQSPIRRGRLRRIDMLDAPAEPVSQSSTRAPSLQRTISTTRGLHQAISEVKAEESSTTRPTLTRSNSSQTKLSYGKARNTYGKERSYLADMVDDLEALSYDSSQEASQRLASQLAANSGPSQLQLELELESSSSEDGVVPLKLKSIHELRQAGTNDRYSRDLEALLLDIDPSAAGANRNLRIQACTKLFLKLSQESFATFILDQGLDRLVRWSRQVTDKLSQLLLSMVFWRMIHVKGASPAKVRTVLQAVATSTSLITDFGNFASLVRDRKENLSKSMIRELMKFESDVIVGEMLPAYEGEDIVPAAVVLAALHDALQKLMQAGLSNVSIGEQSIKRIVHILTQVTQQARSKREQDKFVLKTILSLLKLFSGPMESDLGLNVDECVILGDNLSLIIGNAVADKQEDLLQAVLHFAVSFCNDKPTICRSITKSKFIEAIVTLSDERFSSLINIADSGGEIDTAMLDSIILSLASLLNVTEYDDSVRVELAFQKLPSSKRTVLSTLTKIYVQAAPQADTAMTAEKVQLQVAFGWLSLLICNLCLEDKIWADAQQILTQSDLALSDVVASAKELLIHLQTVEMGQRQPAEDESTVALDGFTLRFGAILSAVKIA